MKKHSKTSNKGILIFFKELMNDPKFMGAALPSSKYLSQLIAKQIKLPHLGTVVEIGAGTGVVTQALLKRGVKEKQLIIIERSASLCQHLREKFPKLEVVHGDAVELNKLLSKHKNINLIVSSLPLRSLPMTDAITIGREFERLLPRGGELIQFTYSWRKHHPSLPKKFHHIVSASAWRNLPPARVDVFRKS